MRLDPLTRASGFHAMYNHSPFQYLQPSAQSHLICSNRCDTLIQGVSHSLHIEVLEFSNSSAMSTNSPFWILLASLAGTNGRPSPRMNGWGGTSFFLVEPVMASVPSSSVVAGESTCTEWLGPAPANVAIPMPDSASPDGILPSADPGKGWRTQTSALRYSLLPLPASTGNYLSPQLSTPRHILGLHQVTDLMQ